jgi:hypothetical protein
MGGMIVMACITLWPDITYPNIYGGPRRMSASWIIACLLGSLALATLALYTWGVGFGLGKSLVPFLLSRGEIGLEIVGNRDWILLSLVYLILPIWATLVIGLPTGLVFSRHRVKRQPDF